MSLADWIRLISAAARFPLRNDPAKSQFLRPSARSLSCCSAWLLSMGSPWHELASSDIVKQAIKAVLGFAEQVEDLAGKAVSAIAPSKVKAIPLPPVANE